MKTENYSQANNFVWFVGVIEDINDPKEMGRVKVRCFGFHNESTEEIATDDLPWAHVMLPATEASVTGIGRSATGLLQGSWVVGFFKDGTGAQDPLIMGSLPSMYTNKNENKGTGFSDPDNNYPVKDLLNEPDITREARKEYQESFAYKTKEELRKEYNVITLANADETWKFPNLADQVKPVYPANHVYAFEGDSNVVEYDSTKDAERFSHVHKSGTHREIDKDGNEMEIITGKRYQVIAKGDNVYVKGGCNLTIEGGCRTKITGDWNIEVDGNVYETITGNQTTKVTGNIDIDGAKIELN